MARSFTEYDFAQGYGDITGEEADSFRLSQTMVAMHEGNRQQRLFVLPALQEGVGDVLKRYLGNMQSQRVLQVGSGAGFFDEFLRPPNLETTFSFDINLPSLLEARKIDRRIDLFQGDVYRQSVASSSMDAVVGLSSFDSFIDLPRALKESARTVKPGGLLFLFQDVVPHLHAEMGKELSHEATENYHEKLVESAEQTPNIQIIEGAKTWLDTYTVENRESVIERAGNKMGTRDVADLLGVISYLGVDYGIGNSKSRFSKWVTLKGIEDRFNFRKLTKVHYGQNDLVQIARMHYLVLRKLQ